MMLNYRLTMAAFERHGVLVTERLQPIRKIIDVTVDEEGLIQIEQFDPVEEGTADIVALPYQDVPWLIDKLVTIMLERKLIPDGNDRPKPN